MTESIYNNGTYAMYPNGINLLNMTNIFIKNI